MYSHVREREREETSVFSFIRIPFLSDRALMISFNLRHLLKGPKPNTVTLRVRDLAYKFLRDIIQSLTPVYGTVSPIAKMHWSVHQRIEVRMSSLIIIPNNIFVNFMLTSVHNSEYFWFGSLSFQRSNAFMREYNNSSIEYKVRHYLTIWGSSFY